MSESIVVTSKSLDRGGRIFTKFFGPVARGEVEETLRRLLAQGT